MLSVCGDILFLDLYSTKDPHVRSRHCEASEATILVVFNHSINRSNSNSRNSNNKQ